MAAMFKSSRVKVRPILRKILELYAHGVRRATNMSFVKKTVLPPNHSYTLNGGFAYTRKALNLA